MNFIARLRLVLTYGPEIKQILQERRREQERKQAEEHKYRLNLCYKHRQEQNRSHFAEHNCHYCQAQGEIGRLRNGPYFFLGEGNHHE